MESYQQENFKISSEARTSLVLTQNKYQLFQMDFQPRAFCSQRVMNIKSYKFPYTASICV